MTAVTATQEHYGRCITALLILSTSALEPAALLLPECSKTCATVALPNEQGLCTTISQQNQTQRVQISSSYAPWRLLQDKHSPLDFGSSGCRQLAKSAAAPTPTGLHQAPHTRLFTLVVSGLQEGYTYPEGPDTKL